MYVVRDWVEGNVGNLLFGVFKNKVTVPLYMGGEKPALAKLPTTSLTSDNWKCYLDICATYHNFFVRELIDRVYSGKTAMNGSCNAGTLTTNTRGWYVE